jgi:hypothetical protein
MPMSTGVQQLIGEIFYEHSHGYERHTSLTARRNCSTAVRPPSSNVDRAPVLTMDSVAGLETFPAASNNVISASTGRMEGRHRRTASRASERSSSFSMAAAAARARASNSGGRWGASAARASERSSSSSMAVAAARARASNSGERWGASAARAFERLSSSSMAIAAWSVPESSDRCKLPPEARE